MQRFDAIDQASLKSDLPAFRAGDTVKVHVKVVEGNRSRIQVFAGTVIARDGGGVQETFTVRKSSFGTGVERTFPTKEGPRTVLRDVTLDVVAGEGGGTASLEQTGSLAEGLCDTFLGGEMVLPPVTVIVAPAGTTRLPSIVRLEMRPVQRRSSAAAGISARTWWARRSSR